MSITYEQQKAINFYKMICKYISYADKYDYQDIEINFKIKIINNKYFIDKSEGIYYEIKGNNFSHENLTYFEGYKNEYVDNLLNTNIDINLLLDFIKQDHMEYNIVNDENGFYVFINIEKPNIKNKDDLLKYILKKRG